MSRKVLIIAFIAMLTLVCLVACKQDAAARTLIGTWKGSLEYSVIKEEYTLTVKDGSNFELLEKVYFYGEHDETIKGTYKFTSDTEGTLTADVETDVIFTEDGDEKTKSIPFTLAGDKLTITDPEEGLSVVLTKQAD
ncbi:MAG: hypothetical protein II493_08300 [Spirochaetales bacterium]|nr:hypothetical protein [Spirochaetales bacterium]